MGFVGIVQVEDAKNRTGAGLIVNADGSTDVNVKSAPTLQVAGTVSVSGTVAVSGGSIGATTTPVGAGGTVTQLSATTGSQQLLGSQGNRTSFMVKNLGSTNIYIAFGTTATTGGGFPVLPGETFMSPCSSSCADQINVIGDTGGEDVRVISFRT